MKAVLKHIVIWVFCILPMGLFAQKKQEIIDMFQSAKKKFDQKEYAESVEIYTYISKVSKDNKWYEQWSDAENNLGITYYHLNDFEEALNHFLESHQVIINHLSAKKEMSIINNIAAVYAEGENFEQAQKYFLKSYELAKKEKDSDLIAINCMNMGKVSTEMKNYKAARKYYNEGMQYNTGNSPVDMRLRAGLAEIQLQNNNLDEAIRLAEADLNMYEDKMDDISKNDYYIILGKAYLKKGDFNKAESFVSKVFATTNFKNREIDLYNILAQIYLGQGKYEQALSMKDSVLAVHKALEKINDGRMMERYKVKFELRDYQHELSIKEERLKHERSIFIAILVLGLLLVTLAVGYLRHKNFKQKKQKEIALLQLEKEKSEKELIEKQFREEAAIHLLEQERLKNEVEQSNRKLSAKALSISTRNEILEKNINSLMELPEALKNTALRNYINSLREQIGSDDDWNDFLLHFEQVNQGFISRLKERHPDLVSNDVRYICYVFMNLSIKEIGSMLNITIDASRKRKLRISRKLGLDSAEGLYAYLSNI